MKNIGMSLLAVWLVLQGLIALVHLDFQYQSQLLGVLAVAAGVLLFLKR